jgi:formylglycine-generating enzyme required for sulfatase activity
MPTLGLGEGLWHVEMVYIPEGPFYVGDVDSDNTGNFKWQDGTGGAPQITASLGNAINTVNNSYDDAQLEGAGIRIDGDGGLDTDANGTIDNASFPTGYNAFYIMKYEASQGQYRDFLNTLTRTQQNNRTAAQTASRYVMSDTAGVSFRNGLRAPASIPEGAITFGCDLDGDGVFNETNDGEWIAVNYVSWMDGAAYADWAALRPFTETEFAKACRGNQAAVDDEYAWGDATLETATTSLNNSGTASEAPNQGNLNYDSVAPDGPFRGGSFGDGTSTRANAGAGYYGVMELSGNLWERPVTLGNTTGRAFDGTSGDGALSTNGHANTATWPGLSSGEVTGATGSGFRGGPWYYAASYARVADRVSAAYSHTGRVINYGVRCARASP